MLVAGKSLLMSTGMRDTGKSVKRWTMAATRVVWKRMRAAGKSMKMWTMVAAPTDIQNMQGCGYLAAGLAAGLDAGLAAGLALACPCAVAALAG